MSQLQINTSGYTHGEETPLPRQSVFAANAEERDRIVVNALMNVAEAMDTQGQRREAHVLREYAHGIGKTPTHNCTCGDAKPRASYAGNGGGAAGTAEQPLPKSGIDWSQFRHGRR